MELLSARMSRKDARPAGIDHGVLQNAAERDRSWSTLFRARAGGGSCPDQDLHGRLAGCCMKIKGRKLLGRTLVQCEFPTFYWLHAAYFGALTVVGTMSLWWCRERSSISFVDCIFNAVSALTVTGLSSLRVRDFSTMGMVVLMVLMLVGNNVFTSLLPLYVRRFHFFRYNPGSNTDSPIAGRSDSPCKTSRFIIQGADRQLASLPIMKDGSKAYRSATMDVLTPHQGAQIMSPLEVHDHANLYDCEDCRRKQNNEEMLRSTDSGRISAWREPNAAGAENQRSLEQQALITLCWLVPAYMFAVQFVGFLAIVCYNASAPSGIRQLYVDQNINPTFFAIFSSVSAFSNTGISPLDDNMLPFRAAPLVLIPLAFLILAGNTMFPPSMRIIIWGLHRCTPTGDPHRNVYEYLLRYPRRCYTHLFPRSHTIWLVVTVLAFNAVDLVAFCVLDWNAEALTAHMSAGAKLMDGLFQSLNTRSAGMNVVSLRNLSPPMLVLYVAMMYIAVYPVFLSRQNTRVARTAAMYHESDLCIFGKSREVDVEDNKLSVQYRKLLARDSAYIFIYIFIICTLEMGNVKSDPLNYTIFNIIFEVISAYGNVGLSVGYSCAQWRASAASAPGAAASSCEDVPYSFSGKWSAGAKLILVAVMLLGRHRGLPDNIDSAICLTPRSYSSSAAHHIHRTEYSPDSSPHEASYPDGQA